MCVVTHCNETANLDERGICPLHAEFFASFLWLFNSTSIPDMLYEHIAGKMIPVIKELIHNEAKDKPILYVPR